MRNPLLAATVALAAGLALAVSVVRINEPAAELSNRGSWSFSTPNSRLDPGQAPTERWPRIKWRDSVAIGAPESGRLERGVQLPASGRAYFTWDPVLKRSPNRDW